MFRLALIGLSGVLLFGVSSAITAPLKGMQLSFVRAYSRNGDSIVLANADGTNQRVVLREKTGDPYTRYTSPAWSRTGALAVDDVSSDGHEGWNVAVRLPGTKRLIEIQTGEGNSMGATWAPDSKRIAFAGFVSEPNVHQPLYIARVSKPHGATRLKDSQPLASDDPSWSPDGKTIAFAGEAHWPNSDLYLIDPTGEKLRRLARHAYSPSWSPDGRQLVFDNGRGLYTINADGSGLRRLYQPTSGKAAIDPAWSSDGKLIAFTRGTTVWVINAAGGVAHQVIRNAAQPAWKPSS